MRVISTVLGLVSMVAAYHNSVVGRYPFPEERCGCARDIDKSETAVNCGHDECLSPSKDYCQGGYFGCSKTPGMCPLPGGYRNGYCYEPYGTHKICADTNKEVLDWFKSVGNDLSSVVAPGMGWCLCKHWTRGAICCHLGDEGMLEGAINFKASDIIDPDVRQIRDYIEGKITKKEFCCDERYPLSGCTPDVCREPQPTLKPTEKQTVKPTLPEEPPRVTPTVDCAKFHKKKRKCTDAEGCEYDKKSRKCLDESEPEPDTCEAKENSQVRGGKKKVVNKASNACDCHDQCKNIGYKGYMWTRPKPKRKQGKCTCFPGSKINGKIRFPKKIDKRFISGSVM